MLAKNTFSTVLLYIHMDIEHTGQQIHYCHALLQSIYEQQSNSWHMPKNIFNDSGLRVKMDQFLPIDNIIDSRFECRPSYMIDDS